ncbi:MAG: segregation and condensation protein [Planctomycetota bacterium]|jgi:segregation and condensation protein B
MTEHEASTVAEQAPATIGTEAEQVMPSADTSQAEASQADALTPNAPSPAALTTKRRSKKQAERDAQAEHPSLFAINLDDPELPCAAMPFELRVEATILLADRPISDARIAEVLGLTPPTTRTNGKDGEASEPDADGDGRDSAAIAGRRREALRLVREAIDGLNQQYAAANRTFRIESVAGGRQMLTVAAYGGIMSRLKGQRAQTRLSQAALETLAIIAYKQPMLRAQLEAIRGVACGEVLKSLMERRLVKIVGRAEEVGRPMLYGTTPEFLRVFGIANLSDLPQAKDLR